MASLSSLSPELFERIAQNVNPAELSSLRLVDRDTDSKTRRAQTDTCFSEKGIMLSSDASLRSAIQLSKHPRFAPMLRTIVLFVDADDDEPPLNEKIAQLLLKRFFRNLEEHGKIHEIVVTDLESSIKHPLSINPDLTKTYPQRGQKSLHVTLSALNKSSLPIRSLSTNFKYHGLDSFPSNNKPLLSNLSHLSLDLEFYAKPPSNFQTLKSLYIHLHLPCPTDLRHPRLLARLQTAQVSYLIVSLEEQLGYFGCGYGFRRREWAVTSERAQESMDGGKAMEYVF